MTKVRKQKRKKKFRANVNRKRLRNKLQKVPKIECEEIENSWELKRSIRTNLRDMGLAYDPNEALKIPSTKRGPIKVSKLIEKGMETEKENNEETDDNEEQEVICNNIEREKIHVVNKLEADAKAPRERMFRLPNSQVHFVTYLMDKYGDDYKAMARDRKNHYQMTWCQIRAKINTFKSIPEQYAEYLIKSGEIVLDDPTPLEETKRKLGEENAKKYSASRKRKLPPVKESNKSIWKVDSVENETEEFCTDEREENTNGDVVKKTKTQASNGLKKLKLFSDEESGEEEENKIEEKTKKKNKTPSLLRIDNKELGSKKKDNLKEDSLKSSKKLKNIEKSQSSDSEDEEFEGDDEAEGFLNLSDVSSEEELSEDDILDDGEFVTDSNDDDD